MTICRKAESSIGHYASAIFRNLTWLHEVRLHTDVYHCISKYWKHRLLYSWTGRQCPGTKRMSTIAFNIMLTECLVTLTCPHTQILGSQLRLWEKWQSNISHNQSENMVTQIVDPLTIGWNTQNRLNWCSVCCCCCLLPNFSHGQRR